LPNKYLIFDVTVSKKIKWRNSFNWIEMNEFKDKRTRERANIMSIPSKGTRKAHTVQYCMRIQKSDFLEFIYGLSADLFKVMIIWKLAYQVL